MSLEKLEVIDKIEVLEDGQIQVRESIRIMEDGVMLSQSYHRHVIEPDADSSKEDKKVKDVAGVVHTQAVKDAYIAKKAAQALDKE